MNKEKALNVYRALEAIANEYRGRRDQHQTINRALDVYKRLLIDNNKDIPKEDAEQSYVILDRLCSQYITTKSEHEILETWINAYNEAINQRYQEQLDNSNNINKQVETSKESNMLKLNGY